MLLLLTCLCRLRPFVLSKTLSHIWGKLNLPMLLLKVGLLTLIIEEYGLGLLHLFRDWERLQLKTSDYKNHRIFTLRCIHKELVPVSIKLKTTLKTQKVGKIIQSAEKPLLQARIKAINNLPHNNAKQTELCSSKLASILSTSMFRKCQGFIEKAGEIRFIKVKNRQVNKFNNFVKKEGNITRGSPEAVTFSSPQAGRQAGRYSFPGSQQSPLTALLSRKVFPRKEAIPRQVTI